ncbi:MAG: SRPBCC family protein [Acidimicrobiales bacterium]
MTYSDAIDIAAKPEVVFATIADLPSMGRLSPENTGGEWMGGATGPGIGAKFKGTNRRESERWSTTARITRYEPPTSFVFEVTFGPLRVAHWGYEIQPTPGGCRVVESWQDRRNWLVRRPDKKKGFDRAQFTKESIRTTLERLKATCEASSSAG